MIFLFLKFIKGEDPFTLWVVGSTIFTMFVYWFFGAIYTFMDLTNKPAILRKYKIQPGTNEPVDRKRLTNVYLIIVWYAVQGTFIIIASIIFLGYFCGAFQPISGWNTNGNKYMLISLLEFSSFC